MKQDEARKLVLETLEVYTELQLKAIQELKGKTIETGRPSRRRGRRRQSLVDMSHQILTELGRPMHVSDLVEAVYERFDRVTDRDALSSALAKKARQGILFKQTAPATFAALSDPEVDQ
jgi:hypothetical protein